MHGLLRLALMREGCSFRRFSALASSRAADTSSARMPPQPAPARVLWGCELLLEPALPQVLNANALLLAPLVLDPGRGLRLGLLELAHNLVVYGFTIDGQVNARQRSHWKRRSALEPRRPPRRTACVPPLRATASALHTAVPMMTKGAQRRPASADERTCVSLTGNDAAHGRAATSGSGDSWTSRLAYAFSKRAKDGIAAPAAADVSRSAGKVARPARTGTRRGRARARERWRSARARHRARVGRLEPLERLLDRAQRALEQFGCVVRIDNTLAADAVRCSR